MGQNVLKCEIRFAYNYLCMGMFMKISHPCCKLNIWKNAFLGITFEKLFFDKIS